MEPSARLLAWTVLFAGIQFPRKVPLSGSGQAGRRPGQLAGPICPQQPAYYGHDPKLECNLNLKCTEVTATAGLRRRMPGASLRRLLFRWYAIVLAKMGTLLVPLEPDLKSLQWSQLSACASYLSGRGPVHALATQIGRAALRTLNCAALCAAACGAALRRRPANSCNLQFTTYYIRHSA